MSRYQITRLRVLNRHPVKHQSTHTYTHLVVIPPPGMFLGKGMKLEYPEETLPDTRRTFKSKLRINM